MLALFDGESSVSSTIEELLDVIDSSRSTSRQRLQAVSRLEEEFSRVVLSKDGSEPTSSTRASRRAWWDAQSRPRSCVALSLFCLVHRLHVHFQLGSTGKGPDEREQTCSQLTSCFTILQGLCLKDEESRKVCGRKSTLELVLDVIQADYWDQEMLLSNVPAHAIDLLICVTISSRAASRMVESLEGEEVVRVLMEKHTIGRDGRRGSAKRTVRLDEVQENPLAIKCAEFLLFFEYGREEQVVEGEESALLSDSFRSAISQSFHNRRRSVSERERGRSSSPVKSSRRQERVKVMRSKPIQSGHSPTTQPGSTPSSPVKPTTVGKRAIKNALTPFAKSASNSPRRQSSVSRGRSRDRSPLGGIIIPQSVAATPPLSSKPSSPLKAIMGPSPAVQRAQARSVSPIKRHPHPNGTNAGMPPGSGA